MDASALKNGMFAVVKECENNDYSQASVIVQTRDERIATRYSRSFWHIERVAVVKKVLDTVTFISNMSSFLPSK